MVLIPVVVPRAVWWHAGHGQARPPGAASVPPFNLNLERESGDLERRMAEIWHPHLVLWGEKDGWIAPADLRTMAAAMPDCRLITVPGIGPSMNLESPALYAGYFGVLVRWAAGK